MILGMVMNWGDADDLGNADDLGDDDGLGNANADDLGVLREFVSIPL